MTNYLDLARQVGLIARRAGAAILEIYEQEDLGVEYKSDDSPLTRADRAANRLIVEGLKWLPFQAPIISEEEEEVAFEKRKLYEQFWLVDPLDGTREFIKRNGDFTVNIALVESGYPVLGVVYLPTTNELFYAAAGQGSWQEGLSQPLQAATFSMEDAGLIVATSRNHLNEKTQQYIDQLNAPKIVSRGSSLKMIEIAKGNVHLYPRLAPTMEWDTAAAQVILEEAGGKLIDYVSSQRLAYNKSVLLNNYFIAHGKIQ